MADVPGDVDLALEEEAEEEAEPVPARPAKPRSKRALAKICDAAIGRLELAEADPPDALFATELEGLVALDDGGPRLVDGSDEGGEAPAGALQAVPPPPGPPPGPPFAVEPFVQGSGLPSFFEATADAFEGRTREEKSELFDPKECRVVKDLLSFSSPSPPSAART